MSKKWFTLIIILLFYCYIIAYFSIPQLDSFRESIYGKLLVGMSIFAIMLVPSFDKNIKISDKIIIWLFLVAYACSCFITNKRNTNIPYLIYGLIALIYNFCHLLWNNVCIWSTISAYMAYFIAILPSVNTTIKDESLKIGIIIISIGVGAIVGIICLIWNLYSKNSNKRKKDIKNRKKINNPLVYAFVAFVIFYSTILSINISFEFSKPQYLQYIVVDKEKDRRYRGGSRYELILRRGDETVKIGVKKDVYMDFDIDDTLVLSLYDGTLNIPFFIYENE